MHKRHADHQGQYQAAVQRYGSFRVAAFPQPPGGQCLHTGGQADNERNRQVVAETADTGGSQRAVTEAAHHADVDQVQNVLRHHPAHDGQGDSPDHFPAVPVRKQPVK